MEENDPIENKFKSAFSDFENEPPARIWENLHTTLHPVLKSGGFWSRTAAFFLLPGKPIALYLILGSAAFGFFILVISLGTANRGTIRGHAYAGEIRLCRGDASLFKVADKTMPWDSVTYHRSAIIDSYGHFQFSNIKAGNYLLRIAPEQNSEEAQKFLPSWYDRHENSDSCRIIIIKGKDLNIDAHLKKKSE
jgi:hypothetical protein